MMEKSQLKILIAEDDEDICSLIGTFFSTRGHKVISAGDGVETLEQFKAEETDLVLLDIRMPKLDGWQVLEAIRKQPSTVPVLILTALDSTEDTVRGLNLGADDYLQKPIDLAELEARVQAVLRRIRFSDSPVLEVGPCRIDQRTKSVVLNGKTVELSPKEYALLQLLASEPGRVFNKREIIARLWPGSSRADASDVKQYVHLLRNKLGAVTSHSCGIENVKGFGYKFKV